MSDCTTNADSKVNRCESKWKKVLILVIDESQTSKRETHATIIIH